MCAVLALGLGAGVVAAVTSGPASAASRPARPNGATSLGVGLGAVDANSLSLEDRAALVAAGVTPSAPPAHQPANALPNFRDSAPASALAASGIPITALRAYEQAAAREHRLRPACGLTWPLLAGIGRVESDHGRFAGAVLHSDGLSTPPVIGIPLNGHGTALILDTDHGRLDGDTVYDRAVGPMQFIPSTWAGWGVDANHDGVKDPFNIYDAAAAAADYLCTAGRDLTTTRGQVQAILSYNYSYNYVSMVMSLEALYAKDVGITVPILPTTPDRGRPHRKPPLPPVDPGTPRGAQPTPRPTVTPTPTPTVTVMPSPSDPSPSDPSPSDPSPSDPSPSDPSPSDSSSSTDPSPTDNPPASASTDAVTTPGQPPSSPSAAAPG